MNPRPPLTPPSPHTSPIRLNTCHYSHIGYVRGKASDAGCIRSAPAPRIIVSDREFTFNTPHSIFLPQDTPPTDESLILQNRTDIVCVEYSELTSLGERHKDADLTLMDQVRKVINQSELVI